MIFRVMEWYALQDCRLLRGALQLLFNDIKEYSKREALFQKQAESCKTQRLHRQSIAGLWG
jgi:hypothetical protein